MPHETIVKTGHIVKELPEGIEKASDDSLWAIATVEKEDEDGDIVRVDGMDLSSHRTDSPIKSLAQHLRKLPDGTPPIIGRVEEFKRATLNKGAGATKALLFRMSWAKDGSGKVTDLASKYKDLADGGYFDSFSIGANVLDSKPLKNKGSDFIKTRLREISGVTIPANADATMLRALEDKLGHELDVEFKFADISTMGGGFKEVVTCIKRKFDDLDRQLQLSIEDKFNKIIKRFDDFESAYVAKADEGSQPGDRKEPAQEVDWDAVVSSLKSLSQKR
jgi:hypothetical protein